MPLFYHHLLYKSQMSTCLFGPDFQLSSEVKILWSPIPNISFLCITYMENPGFLRKDPNSLQYWTLSRRMSRHMISALSQQRQEGRQVQWERRACLGCWRGEEVGDGEVGTPGPQGSYRVDKSHTGLVPDFISSLGSFSHLFFVFLSVWLICQFDRDDIYAHTFLIHFKSSY